MEDEEVSLVGRDGGVGGKNGGVEDKRGAMSHEEVGTEEGTELTDEGGAQRHHQIATDTK